LFKRLEELYEELVEKNNLVKTEIEELEKKEAEIKKEIEDFVEEKINEIWGSDPTQVGGLVKKIIDLEKQLTELQKNNARELIKLVKNYVEKHRQLAEKKATRTTNQI
jgi:hypothetical protein